MAGPTCPVCHSGYRAGHYAAHLTTEHHRRAVRGRVVKYRPRRRSSRNYGGGDVPAVKVRKHRRSKPNDGSPKVVQVSRYWRRRAYNPAGSSNWRGKRRHG